MNNTIKRSKLDSLIQEIVKTVVKQIRENKIAEESGTSSTAPTVEPLKRRIVPEAKRNSEDLKLDINKIIGDVNLIQTMRGWVKDACPDEAVDIDDLSPSEIVTGVARTYVGGLTGFILADPTKNIQSYYKSVNEMTTTGAVQGYNVPGAFTNKMNRKDRIEVLGYKMTPDGEKEYNRPGDRKI